MTPREKWRRLRLGLATLSGWRRAGWFIPYRYADTLPSAGHSPAYAAVECLFRDRQDAFIAVLDRIDALADPGRAAPGTVIESVRVDELRLGRALVAARVGLPGDQLAGAREQVVDHAGGIRSSLDEQEAPAPGVVVDQRIADEIELVQRVLVALGTVGDDGAVVKVAGLAATGVFETPYAMPVETAELW